MDHGTQNRYLVVASRPNKFETKAWEQLRLWDTQEQGTEKNENTMADDATVTGTPTPKKPTASTAPLPKKPKAKSASVTSSTPKKPVTAVTPHKTKVRGRTFPQNTLEDALAVPMAIKEKNNGKPLEPEKVAKGCDGISHKTVKFFYLAASSRDYGLTAGSRDTETISLTDLGQSIVYPETAEQQRQDKIKAFFTVPLFKDVFEHYGGGVLPEKEFVSSVLFKKFGLDESFHDEFCDLYQKNCKYLSIMDGQTPLQVVKGEVHGSADAIVVGQPGKYAHHAFVIMPFSEKGKETRPQGFFDEVLSSLITPACNAADFGVQTARSHGSDLIHHTIIRQLIEADLVVADLTDHNPNVLFELGIRIALDKPILLIRAKGTPPIFDVDHMMRVCEYDPRLWKTIIGADITTMTDNVKGAWDNREKNPSYMGILKTGQQPTLPTS